MLRDLVLAFAVLVTLTGVALTVLFPPFGFQLLGFGVLLLVGTAFERVRYKRLATGAPDARFQRTAERFRDPATDAPVTVYADPATGERVYVRD